MCWTIDKTFTVSAGRAKKVIERGAWLTCGWEKNTVPLRDRMDPSQVAEPPSSGTTRGMLHDIPSFVLSRLRRSLLPVRAFMSSEPLDSSTTWHSFTFGTVGFPESHVFPWSVDQVACAPTDDLCTCTCNHLLTMILPRTHARTHARARAHTEGGGALV
jgi:hypothetical protein